MLGLNLSQEFIELARTAHHAALMGIGRRPHEMVAAEVVLFDDPAPVYAPPPGHQDHPDDDRGERPPAGDEPAPLQTAPFRPGDRVLYRRDPRAAFRVDRCDADAEGGFYVWYDGGSGIPAARLLRAPADFENAPEMPMGPPQIVGEAAARLWHRQMVTWLGKWWRLVGPVEAERGILFHRARLAEMGECAR